MSASFVVQMPDLTKLDIPEKQLSLRIGDNMIFRDLKNQYRQLEDQIGAACKGDYVLAEIIGAAGNVRRLHIELGRDRFPELEAALLGCTAGQSLRAVVNGEDTAVSVRSVRKVRELSIEDNTIASLGIPGAATAAQYRRNYLREHGRDIALRVFEKLQRDLMKNAAELMELSLDDRELERYHQQQRRMLQTISGDVDRRLMDAYGPLGGQTPEECDRLFLTDNRMSFSIYVWGKTLAERRGVKPTEEEYQQALEYYCTVFEEDKTQIVAKGLEEEMLQMFYISYAVGELKKYYLSAVRLSADEVAPMSLEQ